jgi:hypothetical protein
MSATRRLLPLIAVLLIAPAFAPEVQAAKPRENAQSPRAASRSPAKPLAATSTTPAPPAGKARPATNATPAPSAGKARHATPATPAGKARPATSATPAPPAGKSRSARTRATNPAPAVAEASRKPEPRAGARPLRPRREPLLARHPAASCALDPLESVGLHQHDRARESLREFYWSDMARFFESSLDLAEPAPTQIVDPAFLPTDAVLRDLPAAVRGPLGAVATARVIDRLGEREFNKVSKLLASLGPAQVASLLRADAPTLRGYVWTWLATTKTGGCHLGHLDLDFIEAAVGDRSVAVEHGDDLVYRSLGDYALAARARLANLDPQRFDAFLGRLSGLGEIDPLVRATAHGMLLRRAHWDTLELGLRDPSPPVRAATALGALEMNRDKVEAAIVEHAASDPADLVTELVVGALLGVHDPRARAQLRGSLAATRDERLVAAITRWSGRGDPLEPLPGPKRPLRLAPGPVSPDMSHAPDTTQPVAVAAKEPVPTDSPAEAVPRDLSPRPAPRDLSPRPAPRDLSPRPAPRDLPPRPAKRPPPRPRSPPPSPPPSPRSRASPACSTSPASSSRWHAHASAPRAAPRPADPSHRRARPSHRRARPSHRGSLAEARAC